MKPPEDQLAYLGFQTIAPNVVLCPYVQSYWHFRRAMPLATVHEEYMHPRGGYGIVFNFGDQLALDGEVINEPIFLDGANTISRKMGFQGQVELMGIRFYEGAAYPFLAVPLAELRNEIALLDALDRAALLRLYGRLSEAKTLHDRLQLLESWLIERLALGNERAALIPESLALLRRGDLTIPMLAQQLAISERQLERLYRSQVGMSPNQYARLVRIEQARVRLKQLGERTTTDLAVDLGFYDQSHFIREFTAVVGMTPYRYQQRSRKIEQDYSGSSSTTKLS